MFLKAENIVSNAIYFLGTENIALKQIMRTMYGHVIYGNR